VPEASDPSLTPSRSPRTDGMIGKVLDDRYRIVAIVARGGMGRVYRAEQAPLGRTVAVKVLDVGLEHDEDQEFRTRFVKEAEACSRLTHPNTVRVFDYGKTWDDVLYIVMEYLEGRNLFQALQTDAPMEPERVVRIGRQIAASLREAHGLGLIHRDLKPSNIILTRPGGDDEFVKVVDFGLVKEISVESELTREDALVGSPSYMSPEQIRSAPLDQRSDIYSLGVLLYACLTGRAPFVGATSLNVLMGHLNQPPPPMATVCASMKPTPALEAVVLRCLAKEPEDRYADMDALLDALGGWESARRGAPTAVVAEPTRTAEAPPARSSPRAAATSAPRQPAPPPRKHEIASDTPLVLPRGGPSAPLVAGIGVTVLALFTCGLLGLAWAAWIAGVRAPASVTAVPPGVPPNGAGDTVLPADAPPGAAPPSVGAPEPVVAQSPSSRPAPARTPRRARDEEAPAADAPTAGASTGEASPVAPAPDTPPRAPAPAPASEPAPAAKKAGSDVRDPWESR
jgi:serine/threonine protein kinase